MAQWDTRARAAFLDAAAVTKDKLAGYDAVIAKAATGEFHNPLFASNHVQAAYDAGKPCLAWLEADPNIYAGINPGRWPAPDDDWHCKAMDRALKMTSGAMRAVHGIIVDVSKNTLPDKTVMTGTWMAAIAQRSVDILYARYKLPVYLYMSKGTYAYYKADPIASESLNQVITRNGICFPGIAPIVNGYPGDGTSPWNYAPFAGQGVLWYWWGYGSVNGLFSFLYNGDKQALYKELNYKATTPTTPTEPDDENEPETPTNDDEGQVIPDASINAILGRLVRIEALLEQVFQNTSSIKEVTDGIKGL